MDALTLWQVLLSLVLDIKNNKQRNKGAAVSIQSVLSAGVLKWLKGTGMEEVQLRNLSWAKVLQPKKKVAPHPYLLLRAIDTGTKTMMLPIAATHENVQKSMASCCYVAEAFLDYNTSADQCPQCVAYIG